MAIMMPDNPLSRTNKAASTNRVVVFLPGAIHSPSKTNVAAYAMP